LILILTAGMLVWAGVETARELADGAFPLSLENVFIFAALLLVQPALQAKLGRPGLVGSAVCTVIAFGLIYVGPEWSPRHWLDGRRPANPGEPAFQAAAKATLGFHAALSEGRFSEICSVAEKGAFRAVTELGCSEFLAYLHGELGEYESNSLPSWYVEKGTLSPRVAVEMRTRYERAEARESFDWRVAGDSGLVKLTSYHVNF
jgi:hypothetical protein